MCLVLFTKCPGCVRSLAETDVEVVEFCKSKQDIIRALIESDPAAVVSDIDVFMACDMQEIWGVEEFRMRLTRFHRCSPWNHVASTYEAVYESLLAAATSQLAEADGLPSTMQNAGIQSNSLLFEAHPPVPDVRPLYMDRQVMWLHTLVRQHRRMRRNATLGPMAAAFVTGRLLVWYHGLTPVGVVNLRKSLLVEPTPIFPSPVPGPPPAHAQAARVSSDSAAGAETLMSDGQGTPAAGNPNLAASQDAKQEKTAEQSGAAAQKPAGGNSIEKAEPVAKQNKNRSTKAAAPGGKPTKAGAQAAGQAKRVAKRGQPKAPPAGGNNPKSSAQDDEEEKTAAQQSALPGGGPANNSKKPAQSGGPAKPPAAKPPRRARSRAPAKSAPPTADPDAAAAPASGPSRSRRGSSTAAGAAAKDGRKARAAPRGKAARPRGGAAAAKDAGIKRGRPECGDGAAEEEEEDDEDDESGGSALAPIDLRSPSAPIDLCSP